MSLLLGVKGQQTAPFPASIQLSTLDGTTGFAIHGILKNDGVGSAVVGAGDINADGVDDLLVGAAILSPQKVRRLGLPLSSGGIGRVYALFGSADIGSAGVVELSALDASTGFMLDGVGNRRFGSSLAQLGDIDSDGVQDFVIGAETKSYVIFGRRGLGSLSLSKFNGTNGFVIDNKGQQDWAVAGRGDVNGDKIPDLLVGNFKDDPVVNLYDAGRTYVVLGRMGVGGTGLFDPTKLSGPDGCIFNGEKRSDQSGYSVSIPGDVNGDGISDLLIGANQVSLDTTYRRTSGKTYVIFGGAGLCDTPNFELSNLFRRVGFEINGVWTDDVSGTVVSGVGDVNADGIDDLLVGAPDADAAPDRRNYGRVYVVFGSNDIGSSGAVELYSLDGTNGFAIIGDRSIGRVATAAGDLNGDGIADIALSALEVGKSYVIFGRDDIGGCGTFDLSQLDGSNGFAMEGIAGDYLGSGIANAGDLNGDRVDDLVVGAYGADPAVGREDAGKAYVVFGRKVASSKPATSTANPSTSSQRITTSPSASSRISTIVQSTQKGQSSNIQTTARMLETTTTQASTDFPFTTSTRPVSAIDTTSDVASRQLTSSTASRTVSCMSPVQKSRDGLEFRVVPSVITAVASAIVAAVGTVLAMCACRRKGDSEEDNYHYSTWPNKTVPHYAGDAELQQFNQEMNSAAY